MLKLGHQLLSVPEIPTIFLNPESHTTPVVSSLLETEMGAQPKTCW